MPPHTLFAGVQERIAEELDSLGLLDKPGELFCFFSTFLLLHCCRALPRLPELISSGAACTLFRNVTACVTRSRHTVAHIFFLHCNQLQ